MGFRIFPIFKPRLRELISFAGDQVCALKSDHINDRSKTNTVDLWVLFRLCQIEIGPLFELVPKLTIKEKMDLFVWFAQSDRIEHAINAFNKTILFWLSKLFFERSRNKFIP